jgi:hypothetical protein
LHHLGDALRSMAINLSALGFNHAAPFFSVDLG